jgi:hypothetical protein
MPTHVQQSLKVWLAVYGCGTYLYKALGTRGYWYKFKSKPDHPIMLDLCGMQWSLSLHWNWSLVHCAGFFFEQTSYKQQSRESDKMSSLHMQQYQRWADRYFGPLVRCPADYRNVGGPADWKKERTGASTPAPADYWNWASAIPLFWISAYFKHI